MSDSYDRQIEHRLDQIEKRLDDQGAKLDGLIVWRSWVLGIVAGVGLMLGAFAKNIGDIIKHMA